MDILGVVKLLMNILGQDCSHFGGRQDEGIEVGMVWASEEEICRGSSKET